MTGDKKNMEDNVIECSTLTLMNGTFKVKPIKKIGSKYVYELSFPYAKNKTYEGKWTIDNIQEGFTTFKKYLKEE
ncbi:MAG: hypothetical protein IMZ59_05105 [Actinobacteria bacterium]|nr:hypothetical protein [Actinomycetota bacterium]